MEGLFFYLFGTVAVISALAMITRRDPVTSAFWLIFCFLNVAALFATLQAHLMAVLQVLIYAGAIMVFFLFVTMFLGKTKRSAAKPNPLLYAIAGATAIAIAIAMVSLLRTRDGAFPAVADTHGTIESVSHLLLSEYLFPFELVGLLLTVAVIGAVLLARREAPGGRGARIPVHPRTSVGAPGGEPRGGASDA